MGGVNEPSAHLFVIIGGTGDLARRKLVPALYRLVDQGNLEKRCVVVGVARDTGITEKGYRKLVRSALTEAGIARPGSWCDECVYYQAVGDEAASDYSLLAQRLQEIEKKHGIAGNRVFYLALPTTAVKGIVGKLGEVELNRSDGWTRLVVEKPFGNDLASAKELNRVLHERFDESQIYRIDHYLGKETVQNLLVFRFANSVFESLWHRDRISNVQITVAESLGVEQRAGYYDRAGAVRDMVQNHMSQLLSLVAMEVPSTFDADAIRHEKTKVLKSVKRIDPGDVVFGRYGRGVAGAGDVSAYLDEKGVAPDSNTETFVAMRLEVDTWRWQGVPFFLRTGKRLARRCTEIAVVFEKPPVCLFLPFDQCQLRSNVLLMTLQPNEGFTLSFDVKAPGEPFRLMRQDMSFRYEDEFGRLPDAYETLLLDIMTGDQTLFVHAEEVEAAWRIYTPLIEATLPVHTYTAGGWGPPEADLLLSSHGHSWHSS